MPGRWKERLKRLGRAIERARNTETRRLNLNRAARVVEGLLSDPAAAPAPRTDHPMSTTRRLRPPRNV